MEENLKQLLLKDLCARLPYGVKVKSAFYNCDGTIWKHENEILTVGLLAHPITRYKPYLFPLSSMTEEQFLELTELVNMYDNYNDYSPYEYWGIQVCRKHIHGNKPCFSNNYKAIDWLNKNHFDYRDLIAKGLAIDATGLNIY